MPSFDSLGDKDSSPKEAKRSRTDLSSSILERLSMPMHDFAKPKPLISTSTSDSSPNKPVEACGPNPSDSLYDVEVGPVDYKHSVLRTVSD